MSNFLRVIFPYKFEGVWVFDDAEKDLVQEPFVFGADDILDWMVTDISGAENGFKLLFSHGPFPEYQARGEWVREEVGGNWYRLEDPPMEGWLCPALLKYFDEPPKEIYVRAEPKPV